MTIAVYTSDQLIDRARKKAGWTNNSQTGSTDTDVLRHLNEAMWTEILPRLMKTKEGYFAISRRIALTASESRYRIPKRAAGGKLNHIYYIDSAGERVRLRNIGPEQLDEYDLTATEPEAYYLENAYIVLVPELTGTPTGSLELSYFFRPGQLVKTIEARQITGISDIGAFWTLSFTGGTPVVNPGWTTVSRYDIHSQDSGGQIKTFDLLCTTVSSPGNQITFSEAEVNGSAYGSDAVEIGDWICLAGEAVVPGLPLELHPVLVQAAVVRMAEGLGDETYQYHRAELDRMLQAGGYLFDTRVESEPKKMVSRQGQALYGGGGRMRW